MRSTIAERCQARCREQGEDRDGSRVAGGQSDYFDWRPVWSSCERRLRSWRVPPRWSAREWLEEIRAEGAMAMLLAVRDYEPERNVPLGAYVRMRIMARILTRYREEWAYARGLAPADPVDFETPGEAAGIEQPILVRDELREALGRLSDADRHLIERLFWHRETETQVARMMGLSQQAVNKRKRTIFRSIQRTMDLPAC